QEDMGRFVLVNITNTSSKPVKIEAQSGKVALTVQKEIDGDWIYDMFNMTRKGGYVKVSPKETVVIRKYISKRDKSLKYRFELKCDGKKIKTDEF
ncbi:MAG: hypothetical protein KC493_06070, partial [Bacteriovoracaceae bacterium]|nr:hypothetical protein [Bacteriovoracaceae bacterium]